MYKFILALALAAVCLIPAAPVSAADPVYSYPSGTTNFTIAAIATPANFMTSCEVYGGDVTGLSLQAVVRNTANTNIRFVSAGAFQTVSFNFLTLNPLTQAQLDNNAGRGWNCSVAGCKVVVYRQTTNGRVSCSLRDR